MKYAFGLSSNAVLKRKISELLELARRQYLRTQEKARLFDDVYYAAGSWPEPRRVIMKAEWLEKGPNPRFLVTNLLTKALPITRYSDGHSNSYGGVKLWDAYTDIW